jgi:hypothetical protein
MMAKLHYYLVAVFFIISVFIFEAFRFFPLFAIACAMISIVAIIRIFAMISKGYVDIFRLCCYSTIVFYIFPISYYPLVSEYVQFSDSEIVTNSTLIVFCTGLGYALNLIFPIRYSIRITQSIKNFLYMAFPIFLLQVAMMATGMLALAGTAGDSASTGGVNPILLFGLGVSGPLMPMCAYLVGREMHNGSFRLGRTAISLVILIGAFQLALWLPVGRRIFAGEVLISTLSFLAARYPRSMSWKNVASIVLMLALVVPLIFFAWQFFFKLRVASYDAPEGASVVELIRISQNIADENSNSGFYENIATRPYIISSVITALHYHSGYMLGKGILGQLVVSIPSVLFPNKIRVMDELKISEDAWAKYLGIPINDYANTIFLDSYLDFYIFGFMAYVLIINLLCYVVIKISYIICGYDLSTFAVYIFLCAGLQAEQQMSAWFGCARIVGMLVVLYFVSKSIFSGLPREKVFKRTVR